MQGGRLIGSGSSREVIAAYRQTAASAALASPAQEPGSRHAAITSFDFRGEDRDDPLLFRTGEPMTVRIGYVAHEPIQDVAFNVHFFTQNHKLCCIFSNEREEEPLMLAPGAGYLEFTCPELGLVPGIYYADIGIKPRGAASGYNFHWLERCATLRVDPGKMTSGSFHMPHMWVLRSEPASTSENMEVAQDRLQVEVTAGEAQPKPGKRSSVER